MYKTSKPQEISAVCTRFQACGRAIHHIHKNILPSAQIPLIQGYCLVYDLIGGFQDVTWFQWRAYEIFRPVADLSCITMAWHPIGLKLTYHTRLWIQWNLQ